MWPGLTKAGRFRGQQRPGPGATAIGVHSPAHFPLLSASPSANTSPCAPGLREALTPPQLLARDKGCAAEGISDLELLQHSSEESFRAQVPRQVVRKLFP